MSAVLWCAESKPPYMVYRLHFGTRTFERLKFWWRGLTGSASLGAYADDPGAAGRRPGSPVPPASRRLPRGRPAPVPRRAADGGGSGDPPPRCAGSRRGHSDWRVPRVRAFSDPCSARERRTGPDQSEPVAPAGCPVPPASRRLSRGRPAPVPRRVRINIREAEVLMSGTDGVGATWSVSQ
jgi:hypothetical protein